MNDIATKPLVLNKKSSRFTKWSKEANTFRDRFFRSLYIFLLFVMDFSMFIYSINGRLIESGSINSAVLAILGVVFAISLGLILLFSFSRLAQNIICALATMLFVVMFCYQFGVGNVDTFMEEWFAEHAKWLSFLAIIPSPWLVGLFFGALVFFAFGFSDAILFVTLVLLFSCLAGIQKNEHVVIAPTEYQEVKPLPSNAGEVRENKIIYMMLPKFPSYQFFSGMRDVGFRELRDLLIGFYATNRFEIYPNAFVNSNDSMSNVIDILNQVDYTSATSANREYAKIVNDWNFIHGGMEILGLTNNQLYEFLRKSGFGVSMYAMPGLNFCLANGGFYTDRCVVKSYRTVELYDKKANVNQNINALLGEWLMSFQNRNLFSMAKMLINSSSLKNMKILSENRRVSIEGSADIFEKLTSDYMRDQDGQVYLAYIDLPSDIYIYDEYCNLKPRKDWISLKDNSLYSGGIDDKRKAYVDQMKCVIGQLQMSMDEMYKSSELYKTDIFIQGVSPLRELAGMMGDPYSNFVADKLVNLAIRKGGKPRFLINANICLASDFTKTLMRVQDYCYTLENMPNMSTEEIVHLQKNLINNSVIRGNKIVNIVGNYHDWYENFKAHNVAYQEKLRKQEADKAAMLEQKKKVGKEGEDLVPLNLDQVRAKKEQYNANIFILTDEEAQEISDQNDKDNFPVNLPKEAVPVNDDEQMPVVDLPVEPKSEDVEKSVVEAVPSADGQSTEGEVVMQDSKDEALTDDAVDLDF